MTNEMIILNERLSLMEQGVIGKTGRRLSYEDEDGAHEIDEPEEIHTYQGWKALQRQVRKGAKAVASFRIWKPVRKKKEEGETEPEEKMILVKAFFFLKEQTEAIR